jgi:copper resistance protein C
MRYLLIATLAAVAIASLASAHAHLRIAVPPVNGTVTSPPHEVLITFTESLEPRLSSIEVQDAAGHRVDTDDAHLLPDDTKRLRVGLKALLPGIYTVVWRVTSIDAHRTEGNFDFTVAR